MQEKLPLWRRAIKAVLLALLTTLLLAAFYIAVIMGNPQEDAAARDARQAQPLPGAMASPILITDESMLYVLLEHFPAQLMAAMQTSALTFEQGLLEDVPFENGLARRATLLYRTAEGAPVTIVSIYPARALALLPKGDYAISGTAGLTLASLRSVRMENDSSIRMHAQGEDALYAVTLPKLSAAALRTLTSTLQRYQGD